LGFILPRVFPSADAARPDAVPSALELRAGSLPCGSAPSPLHGVLTFGGSGVFSLENANPSEVPPLDRLADLEPFDRAGLLIPRNPENRLPDSPARLLLHDRRSYRSSTGSIFSKFFQTFIFEFEVCLDKNRQDKFGLALVN
jgi:hypothetical protein